MAETRLNVDDCKWIWFPDNTSGLDAPAEARYFRKTFELKDTPAKAQAILAADNHYILYLNGKEVNRGTGWDPLHVVDVSKDLQKGSNLIAVLGKNDAGPAGLVAKVIADGQTVVVSDRTWKSNKVDDEGWTKLNFKDSAWTNAREVSDVGPPPWGLLTPSVGGVAEDFPDFMVPGHEQEMKSMRQLFYLHYKSAFPAATLWDEWLPMATLWPATGGDIDSMRNRWAATLASRHIDAEGYVSTHQHDGLAHSEGWPFPLWTQGPGKGWHFAGTGVHGYDAPHVKPDGFTVEHGKAGAVVEKGWEIELTEPVTVVTAPAMDVPVHHAPFIRLNWYGYGLGRCNPYLEWTTKDQPEFSAERREYFSPPDTDGVETRTNIPVWRHPQWKGEITRLRINFDNPAGSKLIIKSLHTAYDSRHNINNSNFIRGVADYFAMTGDYDFLRHQIARVRTAMRFAMSEFQTREHKFIYTPWVGHDGRSGIKYVDGKKIIIPGNGIGSNYWDIMPFSGEDFLATIYYYDTCRKLADLEEQIANHPEWNVAKGADAFDPKDLRDHAKEVREVSQKHFWNDKTGRFYGAIDFDGVGHDYGFTFVNCEAIYYGLPTQAQENSILDWLEGKRTVDGDTSTGADIYHWRFGPRSTTKRNLDYYIWGWSNPESIPWGGQVQDGGAVLGWSYHDLQSRLKVRGPDDAWNRLKEILAWFDETQKAGGYRAYYSDPSKGTLQGAGTAGGLGLDKEFLESVLVPQIMLYGFMGFRATPGGWTFDPKLPRDWPGLTITRIHLGRNVYNFSTDGKQVTIKNTSPQDVTQMISFRGSQMTPTTISANGEAQLVEPRP